MLPRRGGGGEVGCISQIEILDLERGGVYTKRSMPQVCGSFNLPLSRTVNDMSFRYRGNFEISDTTYQNILNIVFYVTAIG